MAFADSNFASSLPVPLAVGQCPPPQNREAQLFHSHLLLMSIALSLIMLSATFPKTCLALELFVSILEVPLGDEMIFLLFVMPETVFVFF